MSFAGFSTILPPGHNNSGLPGSKPRGAERQEMSDGTPPTGRILLARFSPWGVLVGAVFFGLSPTPSMVPKSPELQGALGGAIFAIGYLLWYAFSRLMVWFSSAGPPLLPRMFRAILVAVSAIFAIAAIGAGASWQNSIRAVWDLPRPRHRRRSRLRRLPWWWRSFCWSPGGFSCRSACGCSGGCGAICRRASPPRPAY